MLAKCVPTILELNGNKRFSCKNTKLNICHHMVTSSTQLHGLPWSSNTLFALSVSGKGANVILDCVGSSFWEQNIKSVAVEGRWIVYGLLGGGNVSGNLLGNVLRKRVSLIGTTLKSRSLAV